MKLYLDDLRLAPEGWKKVYDCRDIKELIAQAGEDFEIEAMSFDFNLTPWCNGVDVMKLLADACINKKTNKFWPKEIYYHSNDPKGIEQLKQFVEKFEKEKLVSITKNQPYG